MEGPRPVRREGVRGATAEVPAGSSPGTHESRSRGRYIERAVPFGFGGRFFDLPNPATKRVLPDPAAEAIGGGEAEKSLPVKMVNHDQAAREEVLRVTPEHLLHAQRLAKLGSWEHDLEAHRLTWSDEVYRIFGVEPGEFGSTFEAFYALVHPDDRARLLTERNRGLDRDGRFDVEHRIVRPDGSVRYVHERGEKYTRADGRPIVAGIVQDITERREAEEKLRRSEALLRIASRTSRMGGWSLELPSARLHWSDEVCAMHGAPPGTRPMLHEAFEYYAPEWRQAFAEAAIRCMREGVPFDLEAELITSEGRRLWVRSIGEAERDADGIIRRVQGAIQDISSRKRAELKAWGVAARLQGLLDHSPLYISEFDLEGRYLLASRTVAQLLGREPGEIVGRTMHELIPPNIADQSLGYAEIIRRDRVPLVVKEQFRIDGAERCFSTVLFPLVDGAGAVTSIGAITRDVTEQEQSAREREKLETQLRQSQKMEAVGRLAGGVAHDFNNMLGVILGYAELALDDLGESDPIRAHLREIMEAGRHSANLTRQLLAFARRQTVAPQRLNLNHSIANSLKLLGRLIGEDIELVWNPGEVMWPVRMDPAQLDQILANLAVNARDAIAGVGRITIETSNLELTPDAARTHPGLQPGAYALIRFSDTGVGMDAETREQIFEPFFTTKETGKGTGLGLATVYGILKQNQGFVYVESEPGEGATFKIYLPHHLSDEEIVDAVAESGEPVHGRGTILLVEDEAPLMRLTSRLLEQLGYDVISANSPEEALRLSSEFNRPIDLLLSDVVMPNMSGRDLWEVLLKRRPGLKCLFMSGYTADIIAEHGVLHEGITFLQKPFTRKALAEKLREAMPEN